jgi:hypothetical protein
MSTPIASNATTTGNAERTEALALTEVPNHATVFGGGSVALCDRDRN